MAFTEEENCSSASGRRLIIGYCSQSSAIPQQNVAYLVVKEFGDVREEFEAKVHLDGLGVDIRSYAAACVPAHLTGLRPEAHLHATNMHTSTFFTPDIVHFNSLLSALFNMPYSANYSSL